jgi:hypothetical protein
MVDLPEHQIITTRAEFHDAIRSAFEQAAREGCRELFLIDSSFLDWPLGERSVIDSLTRWASAHRKLTVLAHAFDDIVRVHPRWAEWRRHWSHVVECRVPDTTEPVQLPSLLLAPGLVTIRRLDPVHYRASVSTSQADVLVLRDSIDALLQRSTEGFPATILGI